MLDCGTTVYVACGASTYNRTGGKGGPSQSGGGKSGGKGDSSSSGRSNQAAQSPSGNVAHSVPVVAQKEKCGRFAPVCRGFMRSMEWVHQNEETLADIAVDLAELEAASLSFSGGITLFGGGFVVEVGSLGTLSIVGIPALAGGVALTAAGGAGLVHGASNLGKDLGKLHWANQATGSEGSVGEAAGEAAQRAKRITSGQRDARGGKANNTQAGMEYDKHQLMPKVKSDKRFLPHIGGNKENLKKAGRELLEDIVNNPASKSEPMTGGGFRDGGTVVIRPDGAGAVFDKADEFQYFGKFRYPE